MFEPVERSRAFERVVEQIEQAIYSGQLKPGDHLPAERALVEEFKVGRSTVREALRILESLGLLHTTPGSPLGPKVSASNVAGLHRMLHGFVQMENVSLADLVQYRMISGSAANLLAAHLRSPEHLAQMATAIKKMESTPPSATRQFAEQDLQFHQAIADASGNNLLNVVNGIINKLIVNLMADAINKSVDPDRTREDFLALHRQLHDAIEQQDGELAAHLARSSLLDVYGPLLSTEERKRLQLLIPQASRPCDPS
ncbi:FadR/GntR family transcriptional regulator [Leekyejoonella antrihumi]|uniref:FadR family transcriptional regulator n=1 Tax=Leekyejoonella antrihumi TaxID=1660198 RepID=A0A563DSN6_9MICO|nr:FadR/GntR family transcriptional regulator [Leekyejoonella antrihumi]TWP33245.1 FadR family transcriptional regulator [Leekyejoonella antrihumi]